MSTRQHRHIAPLTPSLLAPGHKPLAFQYLKQRLRPGEDSCTRGRCVISKPLAYCGEVTGGKRLHGLFGGLKQPLLKLRCDFKRFVPLIANRCQYIMRERAWIRARSVLKLFSDE